MNLEINGTDYEVRFGLAFVRALDERYHTDGKNGATFGLGLESTLPFVLTGDALKLSEILYTGTVHLKKRPTSAQVDDYVDAHEDIDELFAEVIAELKKQNATRRKATALAEAIAKPD